ncbi:MAG: Hsp70 family protein [Richelia sp. RM1_1_1]|nr:Hsp70 family protein [Richelia sp. RM1_1_1]
MLIGIDFGTCNSSAAVMLNGTLRLVKEPLKHSYSFPSSVYLTPKGEILVGEAAERNRRGDIRRYRREFKRELGQNQPYLVGELSLTPQDLVTEVLKKLKNEAEKMTKSLAQGRMTDAVVTVPATYAKYKRDLMKQAAISAGFTSVKILEEPITAAIYYAYQNKNNFTFKEREIILIYDLGGGTFDTILIQKQGNSFQIISTAMGLENCGGTDFDRKIFGDILNRCSRDLRQQLVPKNAFRAKAVVSELCVDIKHQLSEAQEATIEIPIDLGKAESYQLTRTAFNQMIAPYVEETIRKCDELINSAGMEWKDINQVLMVGGSCRIPCVQDAIQKKIGHSPLLVDEPELAVCQGAVMYGEQRLEQERLEREARILDEKEQLLKKDSDPFNLKNKNNRNDWF